jgi:hypothetical protein
LWRSGRRSTCQATSMQCPTSPWPWSSAGCHPLLRRPRTPGPRTPGGILLTHLIQHHPTLSRLIPPHSPNLTQQLPRLIAAGCPVREDVSLHWDEGSSNSAFTFHVPAGLSPPGRPVWLQCRMGLCSATTAGAGGNILRCLEPSEACRANTTHEESALQQVTVRGPIYLSPSPPRRPAHARDEEAVEEGAEGEDPGHSAQPSSRTLVEVPVEVAIAISLASFLVGALSTGVLWFLHNRALRAKSVCWHCTVPGGSSERTGACCAGACCAGAAAECTGGRRHRAALHA